MSMAFYQGGFALDPKNLVLPAQNISKVGGWALKSAETDLYKFAFTSKKPVPTYVKQVKANVFQKCALERATRLNQTWVFTRNTPTKLVTVEVGQTQAKQNVPGWTGFHAIVTP